MPPKKKQPTQKGPTPVMVLTIFVVIGFSVLGEMVGETSVRLAAVISQASGIAQSAAAGQRDLQANIDGIQKQIDAIHAWQEAHSFCPTDTCEIKTSGCVSISDPSTCHK